VIAAINTVSERLGNGPAICRRYYVHPAVITAYENGTHTFDDIDASAVNSPMLSPGEQLILDLLDQHAA
jgi:DNA topoisomerase-1